MEIRDSLTRDAVTDVATILATAYQRYRRARCIEITPENSSKTVNGELDNGPQKSPYCNEVDS